MKNNIFFLVAAFFLLISCGENASKKKDCREGKPVAIFESMNGFSKHTFELNGQNSKETVVVEDLYLDLELYQSGCNTLEQEYRFVLHGTMPSSITASACAKEIAGIFYSLSHLDPKLIKLGEWAEAIKLDIQRFEYNEAITLQGSAIKARILKQHLPKTTILTIIFST